MLDRDRFFTDIDAALTDYHEQLGPRPSSQDRLQRLQRQAQRASRIATKKRAMAFIRNPLLLDAIAQDLSRANATQLIATARRLLAVKSSRHSGISLSGATSLINIHALLLYGRWMRFIEPRLVCIHAPENGNPSL